MFNNYTRINGKIERIKFNSVQLRMYDSLPFLDTNCIHVLPRQCGSSLFIDWYSLILHEQGKKSITFQPNHSMVHQAFEKRRALVDINNNLNMEYREIKHSALSISSRSILSSYTDLDTVFFDNTLFTDPQMRKTEDIIKFLTPFNPELKIHVINTPYTNLHDMAKQLHFSVIQY